MLSILDYDQKPLPVIFGLSGAKLSKDEKKLFQDANPTGFILFSRNIEDSKQLKSLIKSLHDCMGRTVPVLVDQEGGRVQRLRPPHWRDYPPFQTFGAAYEDHQAKGLDMLENSAKELAAELAAAGFNVNCTPVMDLLHKGTDDSIGDRSFSGNYATVTALSAVVARAMLRAGVIPVLKHLPAGGRVHADSHDTLPVVETKAIEMLESDAVPYKETLRKVESEGMWGMVGHVLYKDFDERGAASCSRRVIYDVIREQIGFKGLLLSDDICMGALSGLGAAQYRAEKVLRSGCDLALHCNGDFKEMVAVAGRAEKMTNDAVLRYNHSVSWLEQNKAHV